MTVDGWLQDSELRAAELAQPLRVRPGIERLLVTSTRRDGTLAGPDVELLEDVLAVGLPVVAAGGIATLDDLRALAALGCEGAVTGSAIWLGRFSLAEAMSGHAAALSPGAKRPFRGLRAMGIRFRGCSSCAKRQRGNRQRDLARPLQPRRGAYCGCGTILM